MEQQTRLLPIQNGHNFRELGGYQADDGRQIKWHKLIRSGHLNSLSDTDLEMLQSYHVTCDIDFRAPDEETKQPDRVPADSQYQLLPVFQTDETDASHSQAEIQARYSDDPQAGYHHMLQVYHDMVTTEKARGAYQNFFKLLLSAKPEEAILYHCTAGKDRTGMGSILLLSALGIDEPTILRDYLLTNQVTADFVNHRLDAMRAQHLPAAFIESSHALSTVSKDYFDVAKHAMLSEYASIQDYLLGHLGLTNTDLLELQNLFLN